jgi:hypothetical protein
MRVFNIVITDDDNCGINAISLVEMPAVEKDFLCFAKEKPIKLQFNDSKHIITGVVALADTPIYRYNERYGEYFIIFTKETIQKMVEKFAKQDLFKSVNLQHDDSKYVDGIYMFESYLVDKNRGICPQEFSDVTDGSWICSYKVDNNELWNEIIKGDKLNGFSLQGFFDLEETVGEDEFNKWLNNYL